MSEPKRCSAMVTRQHGEARVWCPFSHPMSWDESNLNWYGTAKNWLRVCDKTGNTVVWNKKCDCGFMASNLILAGEVNKTGAKEDVERWLNEPHEGVYSIIMRPHSNWGYLPKIVDTKTQVNAILDQWLSENVDGDFILDTYEGGLSVFREGD